MSKSVKLTMLCAILALVAVQAEAFPNMPAQQGGAPATAPQTAPQPAPQAAPLKGTVVETMAAGGYTYVCIENGGQKQWAAMPPTEVKVGETVEVAPGMTMRNFSSKSLGRTFESIMFSQGLIKK